MNTRPTAIICFTFPAVLFLCMLDSYDAAAAGGLPPFFSEISFPSQPLPWTASAYADFDVLLEKLGEKSRLDPASVRAVTEDGTVLATAFDPDKESPGAGVVRWRVPAMPGKSRNIIFRIHFAPKSGRKWEAASPGSVGVPNLLPNGWFETPDQSGSRPEFWTKITPGAEYVRDPGLSHSGDAAVKLVPFIQGEKKSSKASLSTPGKPGVVVEGGKRYSFRFWSRSRDASRSLVCIAHAYWYDDQDRYISHEDIGSIHGPDYNWRETSATLTAPAGARYAMFFAGFLSLRGELFLDDFLIRPAHTPQITTAASIDGSKMAGTWTTGRNIKRLDFGPKGSQAWPGFDPVSPGTIHTAEKGMGWIGGRQPVGIERPLPDDLARTIITGPGLQFAMDLEDGDYRAWLLIGDSGLGDSIIPTNVNWSVKAGGREVLGYHPDVKTWYNTVVFRNFNDWWVPGVDIYKRFISPQYAENTIPLAVTGGRAILEFDGLPLGAMVVYPAGMESEMRRELDRLREDRRRNVEILLSAPKRETPAGIGAVDKKRGYVLFAPPASREILPTAAPLDGEVVKRIGTSLAPGETRPVSFAVYPMKNLGDVSVTVSDLRAAGGGAILSAAVEVAVVRYMEEMTDDNEYHYAVTPRVIQPRNPMPVPGDVATRWWLTIRAPGDAAPGDYVGRISFAPRMARAATLELEVKVLPIKLGPTPITAGLYHCDRTYWYIYWWRRCFGEGDGWLRRETMGHERDDMELLKEFGLNSLSFCDDNRGMTWDGNRWVFPEDDRFTAWMDLYKQEGMGPMPWYGFCGISQDYLTNGLFTKGRRLEPFTQEWEKAYRSLIDQTEEIRQRRGWPEVIYYLSDELSNRGKEAAEQGRRFVELTRDMMGIRTIASMNGPPESVLLPGLKIAMPNHAYPINDVTVAEVRKNGDDLWIYNTGNSRVMWGLYLWRMGAKGRFQWYHRYAIGEPWNAFDGDNKFSVTWVTPGKPLPTPELWAIREGLDDLRYLTALENTVSAAMKAESPAAHKAAEAGKKTLADLRDLVPDEARLLTGSMDPREAGRPAVGNLSDDRFLDDLRSVVADRIVEIQGALEKQDLGPQK
jgi:hypothetical protein